MIEFVLKLRPVDNAVPSEIRMRHLLKVALRQCGLRCVDVRELDGETPDPQAFRAPACKAATAKGIQTGKGEARHG